MHWFTGLPLGTWLTIAGVLLALGLLCLALTLGAIGKQADLKVRGWETRDRATEDPWWMREYPQSEEVEHG